MRKIILLFLIILFIVIYYVNVDIAINYPINRDILYRDGKSVYSQTFFPEKGTLKAIDVLILPQINNKQGNVRISLSYENLVHKPLGEIVIPIADIRSDQFTRLSFEPVSFASSHGTSEELRVSIEYIDTTLESQPFIILGRNTDNKGNFFSEGKKYAIYDLGFVPIYENNILSKYIPVFGEEVGLYIIICLLLFLYIFYSILYSVVK